MIMKTAVIIESNSEADLIWNLFSTLCTDMQAYKWHEINQELPYDIYIVFNANITYDRYYLLKRLSIHSAMICMYCRFTCADYLDMSLFRCIYTDIPYDIKGTFTAAFIRFLPHPLFLIKDNIKPSHHSQLIGFILPATSNQSLINGIIKTTEALNASGFSTIGFKMNNEDITPLKAIQEHNLEFIICKKEKIEDIIKRMKECALIVTGTSFGIYMCCVYDMICTPLILSLDLEYLAKKMHIQKYSLQITRDSKDTLIGFPYKRLAHLICKNLDRHMSILDAQREYTNISRLFIKYIPWHDLCILDAPLNIYIDEGYPYNGFYTDQDDTIMAYNWHDIHKQITTKATNNGIYLDMDINNTYRQTPNKLYLHSWIGFAHDDIATLLENVYFLLSLKACKRIYVFSPIMRQKYIHMNMHLLEYPLPYLPLQGTYKHLLTVGNYPEICLINSVYLLNKYTVKKLEIHRDEFIAMMKVFAIDESLYDSCINSVTYIDMPDLNSGEYIIFMKAEGIISTSSAFFMCISKCIPIYINRTPETELHLGHNYPLFWPEAVITEETVKAAIISLETSCKSISIFMHKFIHGIPEC